jgi:hypothetical protein
VLPEVREAVALMPTTRRHREPYEGAGEPGERWLWAGVLLDALETLNGRGLDHGAVAQAEVRAWIGNATARGPGSFLWICEMLELEPAAVRRALDGRGH